VKFIIDSSLLKEEEIHCHDVQDLLSSVLAENQILKGNSDIFTPM